MNKTVKLGAALLLSGALLIGGCARPAAQPPVKQPTGEVPKGLQHPELTEPFDKALQALLAMNEAGSKKDFVLSEQRFVDFRTEWAVIRPKLRVIDPKLEVHLEDGAAELDLEYKKPTAEIRVYEIDEETVKLGRLLANAAELLGVTINHDLVLKDPTLEWPFNQETRITITLSDHKFEPSVIEIEQHTKVTFVLVNRGKEIHEMEIGHYAVEIEDIKPGATEELTLVLLDAGEFEISCHVPGHYEVGMFATLKVKPAELIKKP